MREFDVLARVFAANRDLPSSVGIPPGDDMGAVRVGREDILVTVDQVADGLHFTLAETPIAKIGRKAITRNLSDVAAMGAVPVGCVAAVCLPRSFREGDALSLFDAMRTTAQAYHCPLFGGDTSMWNHPLIISVTVLAETRGVAPLLRRGAKAGDVICVTGELGGAYERTAPGASHDLDFDPRLAVARTLASTPEIRPTAMIDLSDGLVRDLGHIAEQSGVAVMIDVNALPIRRAAHTRAHRTGREPWEHALGDGEDYELCFTVSPDVAESHLPAAIAGVPITQVGVIEPCDDARTANRIMLRLPDGSIVAAGDRGWEHRTDE